MARLPAQGETAHRRQTRRRRLLLPPDGLARRHRQRTHADRRHGAHRRKGGNGTSLATRDGAARTGTAGHKTHQGGMQTVGHGSARQGRGEDRHPRRTARLHQPHHRAGPAATRRKGRSHTQRRQRAARRTAQDSILRKGLPPAATAARDRANWHHVAQNRLQQRLRLLPRSAQHVQGCRTTRMGAQADTRQLRTLHHAGAEGV